MSDTSTSPVPRPRPSGAHPDPREDKLCTLAIRAAPETPPGPAGVLADRILVHTSWDTGQDLLQELPRPLDGFVMRGAKAGAGVRELRTNRFEGVLIIDHESYATAAATAEMPFVLPQDGLFRLTLEQVLQGQLECGATVALTPTGYLRAGDGDALKAAARMVADLERDDVLFSVPIDIAWLNQDNIGQLIAVLARHDVPKAVFLGAQFDPLERYKVATANLRRLIAEAGHVAVFRTDLTGLDALTHGAFATSIGTGGSLRHIIPFGEQPRSSDNSDKSPSVLFPELMAYFRGSKIHKMFANASPPRCRCSACDGRGLDTFLGKGDSAAAHAHGVCVWNSWITDLIEQRTLMDRAAWWSARCQAALIHYDLVNAQIDQPDGFQPPTPLTAWAQLPAWHSNTAPTRSRAR